MANVGNIAVIATLDTSRYKRGASEIDSANKAIEGSTKSTDNSLQKLNSRLTGMARTGVKVAVTGFAALATTIATMTIGGGISRALNIEDAQAKLKGLGHDAESVTTIMDSALDSVRGTAYGLDAAATIAASAVAAGIKPGQELTKYLSLTADAATIAGVSLDEMGSIFNKVQTGQKAYTQELNQLADRGIPIYQWLQEELGVTQETLRDMVAAGEVDAETYFRAIQKNIGGAALESGKTTRGAWNNMLAAMSRVGQQIVSGPITNVREGFMNITKWIDANSNTIVYAVKDTIDIMLQFGRGVVSVTQFLWNMRAPIAGIIVALATYRATIVAINLVKAANIAMMTAQVTWLKLQTAAMMIARGATVAQTVAMLGLNTALKANPIGLVVAAIGGLIAAYVVATGQTNSVKNATDRLNTARQQQKAAADAAKLAEDNLKGAHLSQQGAVLAVERAQRSYNETVAQFGPDSLEAREAAYQLNRANHDLAGANDRAKQATRENKEAQQELAAKEKATAKAEANKRAALEPTTQSIWGQANAVNTLSLRLDGLNGRTVTYNVRGNIDNQEAAKAAGYSSGAPFKRYKGGPVSANRPYVVGENPDGSLNNTSELFVPRSAGRIINAKDLQSAIGGGGSGITNNIQNVTIASEVDGERWLRRLNGNQEIVSNGLVPTQSYM